MIIKKRNTGNYLVDLIIAAEGLLLILSYFTSTAITMPLLGSVLIISFLLGLVLLSESEFYFRRNALSSSTFLLVAGTAIIYATFYRENYDKIALFMSGLIFLYFSYLIGLDRRNIKVLLVSNVFLLFFHLYGVRKGEGINDLGAIESVWENSNMAGIVYTSSLFIFFVGIFYVQKRRQKIFYIILVLISSGLLVNTYNRGSILAVAFFLSLLVWNRKSIKRIRVTRFFLILSPILIVLAYINYINMIEGNFLVFNKTLAVRPAWDDLFERLMNNPLETYNLESGGLNMAIAGIIEFGLIGFSFFLIFILSLKIKLQEEWRLTFRQVAFFAFLCVFIQQSFESTIIDGAYGLYIFSYALLGIAFSKPGTRKIEEFQESEQLIKYE